MVRVYASLTNILHDILKLDLVEFRAVKFIVLMLSNIIKYLVTGLFGGRLGFIYFCSMPLFWFYIKPLVFHRVISNLPINNPSSVTTGYSPSI